MAWCEVCHYGSECCKLIAVGEVEEQTLSMNKEGKPTVKIEVVKQFKCPQCGAVGSHLSRNFYKPRTVSSTKKKVAKKAGKNEAAQMTQEIEAITGGNIAAMDYSK